MKERYGHVSNSSSSSFVIIGKPIAPDKVTKECLVERDIRIIGKELSDGTDLIKMEPAMLDFVKDSYHLTNQVWIDITSIHFPDDNEAVPLPKADENLFVWAIEVDDHSSDSIEKIEYRYEDL